MKIKFYICLMIITAMVLFAVPAYADYDPSLLSYWKLDETAGVTAYDSTTNDNDGTIDGATKGVTGQYGTAFDFDGDNDYVDIPDDILSSNNSFTIVGWIYPKGENDVVGDTQQIIDLRGQYFLAVYWWEADYKSPAQVSFATRDLSDWDYLNSGDNSVPVDDWTHFAVTFDGVTKLVYLDGTAVNSSSPVNPPALTPSDPNSKIGKDFDDTLDRLWFYGTIDEVAIWDTALNWDQIEFIYDNGVEYFEERGQAPEPASMLFALAGLGFAVRRRHSRKGFCYSRESGNPRRRKR